MPIEIRSGTLEERAVRVLLEVYPITIEELARELKHSVEATEMLVKKLAVKGIVTLDVLPDKTFIRLQRRDFFFLGRNEQQRKALKHKGGKKPGKPMDYDGIMYG